MKSPKAYVKAALAANDVTQKEIARLSGEDVRTVSHVIAGKRSNRAPAVLKCVAAATGLKFGDLRRMYEEVAA